MVVLRLIRVLFEDYSSEECPECGQYTLPAEDKCPDCVEV